jgi:hypothetical protein
MVGGSILKCESNRPPSRHERTEVGVGMAYASLCMDGPPEFRFVVEILH